VSGTIFETERLLLRRQTAADIPALVALWSDPEITRHLGGPRERTFLEEEFGKTARDPGKERFDLWPVIERSTGQLVGHCGLLDKDIEGRVEIELVYIIRAASWGRGYATEIAAAIRDHAFRNLGIRRLVALIDPLNAGSENVALKVGMRCERDVPRPGGARRRLYVVDAADTAIG
jgi:[ribosomal protein S5]-alanine N-acetyltransferase